MYKIPMFAENGQMQIEARYENEDGSITIKYIEVNEDDVEYINFMQDYIGFLQDELLKEEVRPLKIEFSASSPILGN